MNMDKSKEFFVGDINKRELIYTAHLIYLGEVQKRAKKRRELHSDYRFDIW